MHTLYISTTLLGGLQMGHYWIDPVMRHSENVWDAKVETRIRALNWRIEESFSDGFSARLEIDQLKNELDDIYEYADSYSAEREGRRVDRFMEFVGRSSLVELANEFGRRRALASSRIEKDRRLPVSTKIELPELIKKLSFSGRHSKGLLKKLAEATNDELDIYRDEPQGFEYVMALYDIKEDLWYLRQLLTERDYRNSRSQ